MDLKNIKIGKDLLIKVGVLAGTVALAVLKDKEAKVEKAKEEEKIVNKVLEKLNSKED